MMEELFIRLKLARLREVYRDWLDRAAREQMSYGDFLRGLLEEEVVSRDEKGLRRRMRLAGFPFEKTLDQFDFRLRPELKRQVFQNYLDDNFIRDGHSLCLIGAAGLGKTHLAVGIGIRHLVRGYDVRFFTVQALMNRLLQVDGPQGRRKEMRPLVKCDLLILDELGYLPQDPEIGPILYELVAGRYERKALIITSNKSLTEWGRVLHDTALAAALVDRLLHHGEVYHLSGESYRLRGKKVFSPGSQEPTREGTQDKAA